uniref:Uncharacterized protein n=1 Tax=Arundo donax TaxID=35708 RepID=A0A0A9AWQ3_ARUDO
MCYKGMDSDVHFAFAEIEFDSYFLFSSDLKSGPVSFFLSTTSLCNCSHPSFFCCFPCICVVY